MIQVPLTLPIRAAEGAALADLVFQVTGRSPMSEAARHQLSARLTSVNFESFAVKPWSLVADPGAPQTFYVAIDAKDPWLLHIASASSPASALFPKPVLVGRMRTPSGMEVVVNAIPFGPGDETAITTYLESLDRSVKPRPQGTQSLFLAAVRNSDVAFGQYRAVLRKYGLNVAALEIDNTREVAWGAVRNGWREGYSAMGVTRLAAADLDAVRTARNASSLMDINWDLAGPGLTSKLTTAEEIRVGLRALRDEDIAVQAVTVNLGTKPGEAYPETMEALGAYLESTPWGELAGRVEWQAKGKPLTELRERVKEMQETARQFGALLRVMGDPAHSEGFLEALGAGCAGRLYYRLHPEHPVERIAEMAGLLRG